MPTIKYFGLIADITGKEEEDFPIGGVPSAEGLQKKLHEIYPQLAGCQYKLAINQQFAQPETPIQATDEIALLPPFAGG